MSASLETKARVAWIAWGDWAKWTRCVGCDQFAHCRSKGGKRFVCVDCHDQGVK